MYYKQTEKKTIKKREIQMKKQTLQLSQTENKKKKEFA